jgi:hypothetical protein
MVSLAIVVQRPNGWVRLQFLGTRRLTGLDATIQCVVEVAPVLPRQ